MGDHEYDAQFRRGYAGPPVPAQTPPAPVEHVVGPPPSPAFTEHTVARAAQAEPILPVGSDDFDDQDADLATRRRNPFSIALVVVSVVMIAAGGWLLEQFATSSSTGFSTPQQQTGFLLESNYAPALISAGLLGLIGWLVLGAVGRARHR